MALEMDAARLVDFIYIHRPSSTYPNDWITIECNYCSNHTFYLGEDTELPNNNWLAEVAEHVADEHGSQYARMAKGL